MATPTITGVQAGDFSIVANPALTIAPGNEATMMIRFIPSVAGVRTALVAFQNNDSNESPYGFVIQGTGTVGPEIVVSGNGFNIQDGDPFPGGQDGTDFGDLSIVGSSLQRTFLIRNTGPNNLVLQTPMISGAAAGDFSILGVPAGTVPPGGATSLVLSFGTTVVGARHATISIANNDTDENPFDFAVRGTGLSASAPEIAIKSAMAEIIDGDTTPSAIERTDFGTAQISFGRVIRSFTVTNSGSATLNFAPPTITGAISEFSLLNVPNLSLAPHESTRFQIRFAPFSPGCVGPPSPSSTTTPTKAITISRCRASEPSEAKILPSPRI